MLSCEKSMTVVCSLWTNIQMLTVVFFLLLDKTDDISEDDSVFDQILAVNMNAGECLSKFKLCSSVEAFRLFSISITWGFTVHKNARTFLNYRYNFTTSEKICDNYTTLKIYSNICIERIDYVLQISQQWGFIFIAKSRSNQPNLIQGDIVETKLVKQMLNGGLSRGAATNHYYHLWPLNNGYREIPYEINSGTLTMSAYEIFLRHN